MLSEEFRKSGAYEMLSQDMAGLKGTKVEFRKHVQQYPLWLESIPSGKLDHAYSENKWTLRALIGHIIDSHIVILYRLVSFTRGDTDPLPGGNQDLWAAYSGHAIGDKDYLVQGYRKAAGLSEWIVDGIPEAGMEMKGIANGVTLTVRDLHAYLVAHEKHHQRMARERYGV